MKNILIIALLFSTTLYAQSGDRIKAFKTAHITTALNLTSSEAEKFWPVYNAYEEETAALRKKERQEIFQIVKGDMDGVTDAQANTLIEKALQMKATEVQMHREFVTALRDVLPARKILKLHRAEEEFKKILLERMKNRRNRRN